MIRIISILVLSVVVVFSALAIKTFNIWQQPTQAYTQPFNIPKGKGMSWVAANLEKQNIIPDARVFKLFYKIYKSPLIKAGEFDLSQTSSQQELIEKLVKGDVISYQVTLIDGWTFKEFKQHLAKQDVLEHKAKNMTNDQIMQRIGAKESHPEGLFAPETYFYQRGDSDLDILKRSYVSQKLILGDAWQKKKRLSPHIDTKYKVLILAAIIEKETGKESERETISGVFHNRLKIGMKMQTDPTVIYGMGDTYDGNIRRKDLRTDTPYNTYTRYGLTPTPIAMPGKASILAALNPATTKSLYFVGKGDGSHYFSSNLKEHNNAVRKYQLGQ